MYSLAFPKIFSAGKTNLVQDFDAIVQNLKLLLSSEKRELFMDPYFGTNLKRMLYEKGNHFLKDIVIDDICVAINTFMPQIIITHKDVNIDIRKDGVYCLITGLANSGTSDNIIELNLLTEQDEDL